MTPAGARCPRGVNEVGVLPLEGGTQGQELITRLSPPELLGRLVVLRRLQELPLLHVEEAEVELRWKVATGALCSGLKIALGLAHVTLAPLNDPEVGESPSGGWVLLQSLQEALPRSLGPMVAEIDVPQLNVGTRIAAF